MQSKGSRGLGSSSVERGRPEYIVVFREPSERNASTLSKVLQVGQAAESGVRSGVLALRPKVAEHAATLLYERLGVAVADLNDAECKKLLASDAVEFIEPNEMKSIPPVPELTEVPEAAGARGLRGETLPGTPELAYLMGLRDAAELALRSGRPGNGNGASSAIAAASQLGTHSWCLDMVGIPQDYARATGKGVTVAVLDTGIDLRHPDFRGRFTEGVDAVSFVDGESVQDLNGHGTHCAGTIAGPARPANGTRYGVAPDVKLLVCKVLGGHQGSGWDNDILEAMDWAAEQGARIISMSLGSGRNAGAPYKRTYERVAKNLLKAKNGTIVIAASGNESARPGRLAAVGHPASCPSILAVAAVDQQLRVARFSCAQLDMVGELNLSGPGVSVLSSYLGGGYRLLSGTSMATPHVAGVAALHLETQPKLTPEGLWNVMEGSAQPLGVPSDFGKGMVQAP